MPGELRAIAQAIESGEKVTLGPWVTCGQTCRQVLGPVAFDFRSPEGRTKAVADIRRAADLLEQGGAPQ